MLSDTRRAFDSVADDYDGPLGNNALVQRIRARTMAAVLAHAPAGSALLDLGCGTGLDAEFLARRGYNVTAIDWSPEMARRARARAAQAGLDGAVQVMPLSIQELGRLAGRRFDAAYSNLGALNCVPDLAEAARLIAAALRPGGHLIASAIGRICPWEIALFAAKGQWRRARLRFSRDLVPVPLNGETVWTRYFSPREFEAPFAGAGFERLALRALGLFTPPPYMLAFVERHPRLLETLQTVEDRVATWPGLREWGDHFLIVMRKA